VRIQAGAAVELGLLDLHLGEYSAALTHLRLAYGLSEQSLTLAEFVEGSAGLAFLHYAAGEFDLALELAAQARLAAADTGLLASRFGAPAVVAELLVAIEQNRITEVVALSPVALASARASDWLPLAHYAVGTASIVTGRFIEGLDELRRSLSAGQGWDVRPAILSASEGMRGVLLMHLGETAGATAIFESIRPTHLHANCPGRFLAGVRLAAGNVRGALDALLPCDELGELHSSRTLIDVLMIRAAANYELGNPVVADIAFDRALLLASQNGMRTPFLLVPSDTMQRMLGRAADRNQPDPVHDLLDDLLAGTGSPVRNALEPLSARERDIAYHLSLDKTVSQIATELYISTNTVKTHVRSIYRKLGATNRKDALRRVRELGLHLEVTPF
jgi:LuxR family maltose regulon positive regulatory protein